MIFDTHAHYEDRQFDRDREALLASFAGHGIRRVVNVSASWDSLEKTKKLTEKYDWVYGAYGLHPEEIAPVLGMAESDDVPENQESEPASQAEQEAAAVVPVLTEEELYEQLRGYCRFPKAVAVGEIGLDYYWEKDPEKKPGSGASCSWPGSCSCRSTFTAVTRPRTHCASRKKKSWEKLAASCIAIPIPSRWPENT